MIREDKQASLVTEHTLFGSKRYRFVATRARGSRRFKSDEIQPLLEQQMRSAITIFTREDGKRLWMFRDRFYWEDEGLAAEDVTALARQRELKRQRQLDRARSVARRPSAGKVQARVDPTRNTARGLGARRRSVR
jgi:hypothetical protein